MLAKLANVCEFICDTWQLLCILAVGLFCMFAGPIVIFAILGGWGSK